MAYQFFWVNIRPLNLERRHTLLFVFRINARFVFHVAGIFFTKYTMYSVSLRSWRFFTNVPQIKYYVVSVVEFTDLRTLKRPSRYI